MPLDGTIKDFNVCAIINKIITERGVVVSAIIWMIIYDTGTSCIEREHRVLNSWQCAWIQVQRLRFSVFLRLVQRPGSFGCSRSLCLCFRESIGLIIFYGQAGFVLKLHYSRILLVEDRLYYLHDGFSHSLCLSLEPRLR